MNATQKVIEDIHAGVRPDFQGRAARLLSREAWEADRRRELQLGLDREEEGVAVGDIIRVRDRDVLVLFHIGDEGLWRVVPVSKYETPATAGEVKVGENVYQVFNTRYYKDLHITNFSLSYRLPWDEFDDVLTYWNHYWMGGSVDEELLAAAGIPIDEKVRAFDPGAAYEDEEQFDLEQISVGVEEVPELILDE